MRLSFVTFVMTLFLACDMVCDGAGKKPDINLRPLFGADFPRWDRNGDGVLDLKELNVLVENPQVHGLEAAAVVVLRKRLIPKESEDETRTLTRAQVMALADDAAAQREVDRISHHLPTINRALFLPGDPNLATFHQGGVGDCYLMSALGAFTYRDPQAVRAMIKPLPGGSYEVHFASGRTLTIPPVTDAELVMGAPEGSDHGIWMAVMEKAYAEIRREMKEEKSGVDIEEDDTVTHDLIGHGGSSGPVIAQFTGHKPSRAPLGRWFKEEPDKAADRAHDLLVKLTAEHRLITVGTTHDRSKKLPVPHAHAFGLLGYDPARRMVRVFNPWGNHRTPKGPPGLVNGYVTEHGIFEVPLKEFVQIFNGIVYETDNPLKS